MFAVLSCRCLKIVTCPAACCNVMRTWAVYTCGMTHSYCRYGDNCKTAWLLEGCMPYPHADCLMQASLGSVVPSLL